MTWDNEHLIEYVKNPNRTDQRVKQSIKLNPYS